MPAIKSGKLRNRGKLKNKVGYRILDVKVAKVGLGANKLVIKRKKAGAGKGRFLRNIFVIDASTLITGKNNRTITLKDVYGNAIPLAKIKPGSRVNVDYVKENSGRLVVSDIIVTSKSYRGGEGEWLN